MKSRPLGKRFGNEAAAPGWTGDGSRQLAMALAIGPRALLAYPPVPEPLSFLNRLPRTDIFNAPLGCR